MWHERLPGEYRILVHPALLGKGRAFLKDDAKQVNLKLVDTTVIPSGVAILTYQPVRWRARQSWRVGEDSA